MDIEERITSIEKRMMTIELDLAATARYQLENAANLNELITELRPLVNIHKNIQGTLTTGAAVQKFGIWLAKWPIVFTAFYAVIEYFKR